MDPNNPNNPYFDPFIKCYRPQLDPNNQNPNQFLTFSNWYPQPLFSTKTHPPVTTFLIINRIPMLTWFWKYNPMPNRLHRVTSSSRKYTTTQSDSTGRCFVNLNESDEEVEMDMPPPTSSQRPPGRNNQDKRPQVSSSTDYKDTLDTISESLQKFVGLHEQKQYNNDMKLLWTPTNHLTGRAREIADKTKERIIKKYNLCL
ncbi:hypothetical protein R6Q57_027957 [Mikania cordata]